MKKISKFVFSLAILLCFSVLLSGCEVGKFKSFSISYVGTEYEFDEFSSAVLVEYGQVLNLSKNDFLVYRVNTKNKKQKTKKFQLDLSSLNGKRLDVGDYKIYFENTKENYSKALTIRVFERVVEKPTFDFYSTEYCQNAVNIVSYLESQPGFDASAMVVENSSESTISAVNVGRYKTKINLYHGCVWNTSSERTDSIVFEWEITPKIISEPKVASRKTQITLDDKFEIVPCGLTFEPDVNSVAYEISDSKTVKVGDHCATVKIINNNYVFKNGEKSCEYPYTVKPLKIDDVTLSDSGKYEYSGQTISPNLEKFNSTFMEIVGGAEKVSAGKYVLEISFKEKYSQSLIWRNSQGSTLELEYEITKKKVTMPTLKNNMFEYSGTAPKLEFENFDENLFVVSDTSKNISVGWYKVYVSPKNQEITSNFAFEGTDVLGVLPFQYKIEKAKIKVAISWNVPDGQSLCEGLTASVSVVFENNEQIQYSQELYYLENEQYVLVNEIEKSGKYRLILSVENYVLLDAEGQNLSSSEMQKDFEIL